MLKKYTIQKICFSLFCLLAMFILYLFPKVNPNGNTPKTVYKTAKNDDVIFLLDKNGYVSRISTSIDAKTDLEKIKSIIKNLTIDDDYNENFSKVIPLNTKLNKIDIQDDTVYLDFSKEFLNVSPYNAEKMLEAIIYSLTSTKPIKNIILSVEKNILTTIPGTNEKIPTPLNRTFGINKMYDLTDIKGSTKTTLYYLSKNSSGYYYVPVTKITNSKDEKIEIIIKELTSSPIYNTSLMSYLSSETILKSYEFLDKKLILDFNNAIFSNSLSKDIEEEVTYAINLSIKDNYDVEKVFYNVDNEKIATFDLKNLD